MRPPQKCVALPLFDSMAVRKTAPRGETTFGRMGRSTRCAQKKPQAGEGSDLRRRSHPLLSRESNSVNSVLTVRLPPATGAAGDIHAAAQSQKLRCTRKIADS